MLSRFIRYGLKCEMYTLYDYLLIIMFNQAPLSLGRHTGKESFAVHVQKKHMVTVSSKDFRSK